jgi:calcineurin-like phosphoesterase family protein
MSKVFVVSDTHYGHHNIIRFCSRPFKNAPEMDAALIERWNQRVSNADTVYFLGDFAFAPQSRIIEVLGLLNFKEMFIVPGNHDEKLRSMWAHPIEPVWESHGVHGIKMLDEVHELRHEGRRYVMCHYPMEEWNGKFHDSIHLHGHCHSQHSNGGKGKSKLSKLEGRYDIGVDMFGGPVELTGDLRYLDDPRGWE